MFKYARNKEAMVQFMKFSNNQFRTVRLQKQQ